MSGGAQAGRRAFRESLDGKCCAITYAWLDITWNVWVMHGMPDIPHLLDRGFVWERKA